MKLSFKKSQPFPAAKFPTTGYKIYPEDPSKHTQILRMAILNSEGQPAASLNVHEAIMIEVDFVVRQPVGAMNLSFMIHNDTTGREDYVSATHTQMVDDVPAIWPPGQHKVQMEFPAGILNCGRYYVRGGLGALDDTVFDYHDEGLSFELTVAGEVGPHDVYTRGLLAVIPRYRHLQTDID